MIARMRTIVDIKTALERSRAVALLGPRQCGKTTLARQFVSPDSPNYFDLEDPLSLARLDEAMTALRGLTGLVVIDEVQRRPDLFPILRVLTDREPLPARFLILSRASPALHGERTSSRLSWRGTSLNLASPPPHRLCFAFGPCLPITMARYGMRRSRP